MSTTPLALSDIVDVTVTVSPAAVTASSFNQGLFIGPSAVIPSYGAGSRVRLYSAATWFTAMLTDGFTVNEPEYIAMGIYFSQTPQPQYGWVGRQDLTAISTFVIDVAGTGWAVGDQFTVTQAGASNIVGRVTAAAGGVPSAIALVQQGTGAAVAVGLVTTAISPSVGVGLTVSVTTLGESLLQAAAACRAANSTWYGLAVNNPTDADNLALSEWADPLWTSTRYYVWSPDAGIPNGTAGNLALQLQNLKLRVLGVYSTTQGGLYPDNIYAAAGLMGLEMGYNTGLAGSFFTVAHKQIAGIATEPLSDETQFTNIKAAAFNVYGNFGGAYQLLEPGLMSNGAPSYLWLYLAVLVNNLQINELNVLQSSPAVPQTNAGEHLLIQAANQSCQLLSDIGFIAPGTWEGVTIDIPGVSLTDGQAFNSGFLNQAQPTSQQSSGDRAAGKGMPIYCAITTAGAVLSLLIGVYTQL